MCMWAQQVNLAGAARPATARCAVHAAAARARERASTGDACRCTASGGCSSRSRLQGDTGLACSENTAQRYPAGARCVQPSKTKSKSEYDDSLQKTGSEGNFFRL